MECSYGSQPIVLNNQSILSFCGVQQGDPLGPLGFSLALHPIVRKIKEQVPGLVVNAWYLDDGTLCGSPADLVRSLSIIESDGPSNGLFLNRAKSLIYTPSTCSVSHPLLRDIPTTSEGLTLLGSPIGAPTFCESSLADHVVKIRAIISNLSDLLDAQMETALL